MPPPSSPDPSRPVFTLVVVTSADGFIAKHPSDSPAAWASPEEQALFFEAVEAADWSVMGRHTHEAADKPQRRRIVFSSTAPPAPGEWRRPTQLWLDPASLRPSDLATLVGKARPLRHGLILGGTRVHDWFHAAGAIDRVALTVEPLEFGVGLPIFSGQRHHDPVEVLAAAGYRPVSERALNAAGTRHILLKKEVAA